MESTLSAGARVDSAIGRTPMVRLQRVIGADAAEVWVKLEGMNPGGSIKDRTAYGMICDAEQRGVIHPAIRSSSRHRATPASASRKSRPHSATS